MDPLKVPKQVKHRLWLLAKRVSALRDVGLTAYSRRVPYRYRPERDVLSFLALPIPRNQTPMRESIDRRIFVAWAGPNEMTPNRISGLESIRRTNSDFDVVVVTPENLSEWVVPEAPLHPGYELLSCVHRSDYLHSYLLHHHGGGYTGLKGHPKPWRNAFEAISRDPDIWLMGYPIPSRGEATRINGAFGVDIHRRFGTLPGTGAMIARAYSPLTYEWQLEANRRMDYYLSLLRLWPGNVCVNAE